MKKLKHIIIVLIAILICTIIILIILYNNNKKSVEEYVDYTELIISEEVIKRKLEKEEDMYAYIAATDSINELFDYIVEKDKDINNSEAIVSILDSKYITNNRLSKSNVIEFFNEYKDVKSYVTKEIYKQELVHIQSNNGVYLYINGIIRSNGNTKPVYILMKQDFINSTYNISFLDEDEFDKIITGEITNNEIEINLVKNNYNEIHNMELTDERMSSDILQDYINILENNISDGYNVLDKEYQEKRFGSLEVYKQYIQNNKEEIEESIVVKYQITSNDNYTQYICIDQYGKYYIFRETAFMQYSLILDTYTVDLPEFLEKYNNTNAKGKSALNIQKIIDSLNAGDYKYAYNKLSSGFKNNYFKTLQSFEDYINKNMYKKMDVQYISFEETSKELYTYKLNISNAENAQDKVTQKTFVIELGEGTDFEIAFNI